MISIEFQPFPKIPRLSREVVITEKIDGTNACVAVFDARDLEGYSPFECPVIWVDPEPSVGNPLGLRRGILAANRSGWLTRHTDNYGFGNWVYGNRDELAKLGLGYHFGEWWGAKINRAYGKVGNDRVFSLFNTSRWNDSAIRPKCCSVVPTLYQGRFSVTAVDTVLEVLRSSGSYAAEGFMNPEGIVVYHTAANQMFKKTLKDDERAKGDNG